MKPVTETELRRRSEGVDTPETMDLDGIEGPAYRDAGGDDSPDLNPDGSLKTTETDRRGILARLRAVLPW
ncbi:MAG: hypothetical protein ABEJ26_06805 [Halosimplex sp.]